MSFKKCFIAATFLSASGLATTALAGTATTSFNVTTTVINDCTVSSTPIAFANYDPTLGTALTAQGAISAKCTKGDVVSVALSVGANPGTGSTVAVPVRQMAWNGNFMPYHIYMSASGGTEWGTGVIGTNEPAAQTSTSATTALTFTTYGSLPANIDVPAGSYTDSVVATVSY